MTTLRGWGLLRKNTLDYLKKRLTEELGRADDQAESQEEAMKETKKDFP